MYGLAYGSITYGASDIDQSVASVLDTLLANPQLDREFRIVASPYNPATEATTTVYASTHGGATEPGDSPANQLFRDGIIKPYNASFGLGGVGDLFTGAAFPAISKIAFTNGHGKLDPWVAYDWDDRELDIYVGQKGAAWTGFQRIIRLLSDGREPDLDQIVIPVRDRRALFDRPIQKRLYYGTGPCLRFDGVGDVVGFGDILDQGASDSFTVELLARTTISGTNQGLCNKKLSGGTDAGWRFGYVSTSSLFCQVADGTAQVQRSVTLDPSWYAGELIRLSFVADRSTQTLRLYVEGILVGTSASISAIGSLANAQDLQLGTLLTNTTPWVGDLDDFRFWSVARTAAEIQADMHRELTDAEVQEYVAAGKLALYAKLNDDTGATAADETTNGYDGTITGATWVGSSEGESDIAGKPKPLKFGLQRQGGCVLVDQDRLVYQVHDGAVEGIGEGIGAGFGVRDGGVLLTFASDVADVYDAGAPTAGQYYTSKATGLIRLGDAPESKLTADVLTAQTTAADIIREIATTYGGLTDPDDLHTQSFADLNVLNNATVAYSVDLSSVKMTEALTAVAASIGAWWGVDRLGRLKVGRIDPPSVPKYKITQYDFVDPADGGQFQSIVPARPVDLVRLGYRRYEVVLGDGDVLASITATDRRDLTEEYRRIASGDETAEQFFRWDTAIDELDAAQAEADRILAMLEPHRDLYTVRVLKRRYISGGEANQSRLGPLFKFEFGDVVELIHSRLGLSAGQSFVVVGFSEDVGGHGEADSVVLQLWG